MCRRACEQQLMLAQGQQIARTRDEFVVIDRRIQKIRGAGIEGLQAEASLFVDGYDDDGKFAEPCSIARKRRMNSAPSKCGIL